MPMPDGGIGLPRAAGVRRADGCGNSCAPTPIRLATSTAAPTCWTV